MSGAAREKVWARSVDLREAKAQGILLVQVPKADVEREHLTHSRIFRDQSKRRVQSEDNLSNGAFVRKVKGFPYQRCRADAEDIRGGKRKNEK